VKIMIVAGARPNFMKVAPLMRALEEHSRVEVTLVHTGQHYDAAMSDSFFRDLGLRLPDINLQVGSGSHAEQTARIMMAFEPVCLETRPYCVVVVGDVNSTVACALVATKLGIRVAHVEAGLRSGDRTMPEEINRLCTDAISDLLFTTDELACENLRREGVPDHKIHFTGNTMIDTLIRHLDQALQTALPEGIEAGKYGVVTLHRPANVDDPESLRGILGTLVDVSRRIRLVFPAHPRTRKLLAQHPVAQQQLESGSILLIDPLNYLSFIGLVARSQLVLTDSGGIQEETTYLGIPCITMRDNTERPITCTVGTNILAGTDPNHIRAAAMRVLDGQRPAGGVPDKWDGQAGKRIVDILVAQA
jgi:UDP-N-acetylglucosamine 2-epimerase (non-hydrolysing)